MTESPARPHNSDKPAIDADPQAPDEVTVLPPSKPRAPASIADPAVKLFCAIPAYGGMDPHFVSSLLALVLNPPCSLAVKINTGDSLVSRARNNLASDFLASDCTHLLFLDCDLIFSPSHVARLISRRLDLIGGLYPKKQPQLAWVCNAIPGAERPAAGAVWPVRYIGTGFMLISRHVLETMRDRIWPSIRYAPDGGERAQERFAFFDPCVRHELDGTPPRYLSEDWAFCQRWLDLGGQVYADASVILKHVGQMIYPIEDPIEHAEAKLEEEQP